MCQERSLHTATAFNVNAPGNAKGLSAHDVDTIFRANGQNKSRFGRGPVGAEFTGRAEASKFKYSEKKADGIQFEGIQKRESQAFSTSSSYFIRKIIPKRATTNKKNADI